MSLAAAERPQESLRLKGKVEGGEFHPDMEEENGAASELEWRSLWAERTDGSSVFKRSKVWVGEGTLGVSAGGQEELCGCYQGIVMISWFFYFSLIPPAPHFPYFSAGWPWGGGGGVSELPWLFCKL